MKTEAKAVFIKLALAFVVTILLTAPAYAKKDKKKGAYPPPTVTAEQAIGKAKEALPKISVGKVIVKTGKRGEKNLEVMLVFDGQIVSRVRVNPTTGEIMPKGMKIYASNVSTSQEQAANIVRNAIPKFEVGSVRLGKQGEWIVDITLNKVTVADLKVHGGNGSIMLDWKAARDAGNYFY